MDDDDRTYAHRVRDYVNEFPTAEPILPLTHAAALSVFRTITSGDSITPKWCKRMGEPVTYLFYGKPAYRTPATPSELLSWNIPIIFVIDPMISLDIRRVVPFDSGAFVDGLYGSIFPEDAKIAAFELDNEVDSARRYVSAFFGDNASYFSGRSPNNVRFGDFDFELQGIQFLANRIGEIPKPDGGKIDERSASVELQIASAISIPDHVKYLLVPDSLLGSRLFWRTVKSWGLEKSQIESYYRANGPGPGAWYGQMYAKLKELLERDGVLDRNAI
jgi:hypothetical protein